MPTDEGPLGRLLVLIPFLVLSGPGRGIRSSCPVFRLVLVSLLLELSFHLVWPF